jgi:environmental stress-induced protein Ves
MTGRIIGPDLYRRMPWKNGGGETAEIATFPPNADLATFGWRVSTATVGSDGPFSIFPGVDRTLCVLSGNGVSLAVGSGEPAVLHVDAAPFSFPADMSAAARLVDGPITDLNVMTRRATWRHAVSRHRMRAGDMLPLSAAAAQTILFCRSGTIEADTGTSVLLLTDRATLLMEGGAGPWTFRAAGPADVIVIAIDRASG